MRTVLTALLLSASWLVAAQTPSASPQRPGQVATPPAPVGDANAKPTAVVRGRILTANGRPVQRASVRMLPATDPFPRVVLTDLDGRYAFTEVRAGDYRISAGKTGYLPLEYGQQRARERGRVVSIRAGETIEKLDITLPASGAIVGRVVDQHGDPVEAIDVRLMQVQYGANRRVLMPVPVGGGVTNDEGRYRLYGVPPGQYVVMASIAADQSRAPTIVLPPGYASTYYPGTTKPVEAKLMTIGLSQEAMDIDVVLARAATARISGVVIDSFGKPLQGRIFLNTSQRSGADLAAEPLSTTSNPDGSFEIRNVPPGEWVLQVTGRGPIQEQDGEFVSQFMTPTGTDITDVRLQTSAGSRVEGRVVFEGVGDVQPTGVTIGTLPADLDLAPIDGLGAMAAVRSDGTFALDGLNGTRRFRLVRAPPSWSLKAIRANGTDVTDAPVSFGKKQDSLTDVEIVLTNRAARVSGSVNDTRGRAVAEYAVIVFAPDGDRWYQGSRFLTFSRSKPDGTLAVADLPPGEYVVAAVDWMQGNETSGEWQDPAFLNAIAPRATRVTLAEGQAVSLTAVLIVR